jgi:hypothetical protein
MASMSAVSTTNAVDVVAEISGVSPDIGLPQFQAALATKNISIQNFTIQNAAVIVSACPPGAWCSGENITACPAGKYNPNEGASSEATGCLPCPAGSYCPTPMTVAPTTCPTGAFCPSPGATAPRQCPAGFFAGMVGSLNCTASPRGSYVPVTSSSAATACASGTFTASAGSVGCTPAASGSYSISIGTLPCPKGSFSAAAGAVVCTAASIGTYVSVISSTAQTPCPAGSFSSASGAAACTPAPPGAFVAIAGATLATPCQAGTFSSVAGSSSCTPCPIGYFCPANGTVAATPCPAGRFCPTTNLVSPTTCPIGMHCPLQGASAAMPCPPGYIATAAALSACSACQGGYKCTSGVATGCGAGTFAPPTSAECRVCPQDFYCPSGLMSAPMPCHPNTTSLPGARASCNISSTYVSVAVTAATAGSVCPVGAYCDPYAARSFPCPAGTFQPMAPQRSAVSFAESCVPASPGYFVHLAGSSQQLPCPAGYMCPVERMVNPVECPRWMVSAPQSTACNQCPAGASCVDNVVTVCGPGFFSLDGSACATCPQGSFCTGGVQQVCAPGTFSTGGLPSCIQCPMGTYCPGGGASALFCIGKGNFSATAGASACNGIPPPGHFAAVTQSLPCPAGSYTPASGYSICLPCPIDTYCPGLATSAPLQCPWFSASVGAVVCDASPPAVADYFYNAANFTASLCPAGSICPVNANRNQPCPNGTYQPDVGSPRTQCLPPPANGTYIPFSGSAIFLSAQPGYYSTYGEVPKMCQPGTFSSAAGAAACIDCPPGTQCPHSGMIAPMPCYPGTFTTPGIKTECQPCGRGYYCPNGIARVACAATTYADGDLLRVRECDTCPAGHYCPSTTTIFTCPAGYYCPMSSLVPMACPAGTFRSPPGGGSLERDCSPCTVGSYCPVNSTQPTPCPDGKFLPFTNGTSEGSCMTSPPGFIATTPYAAFECAPGTYQPANGSTTCLPCPFGSYDAGTLGRITACPLCPSGGYCTSPTLQSTCPGNTMSPSAATSQLGCRCNAGYACTYTKRITAMVTINGSIADFNADVGGIYTSFKNAIAAAAGVLPAQVVIIGVTQRPGSGGRRSIDDGADVQVKVLGSNRLGTIKHSIAVSTVWQPQHAVHVRRVLFS